MVARRPLVVVGGIEAELPNTDGIIADLYAYESTIASSATCDIGSANTRQAVVNGSTAITSFGTQPNRERLVRFGGALTLTHNATSLILPGATSIVTAAGDTCVATSDASGNWRVRSYDRAADTQGAWVAFVPTITAETTSSTSGSVAAAFTLNSAAAYRIAKTMFWRADFVINKANQSSGRVIISSAFPLQGSPQSGVGYNSANAKNLSIVSVGNSFYVANGDGTSPIADGTRLSISGAAELA